MEEKKANNFFFFSYFRIGVLSNQLSVHQMHTGKLAMSANRICRFLPQTTRRYLMSQAPSFLFLPNDSKHIFEQEKLSPQENQAAIPTKPSFDHLEKKFHEVVSPKQANDIVLKLNSNDLLVTMLSKDKVFLGDPTFIIDGSNRPTKFEYATILCSWSEMFNKRIKELREIAPLEYWLPELPSSITELYEKYEGDFDQFFEQSKVFKNSQLRKERKLQPSEFSNLVTIDNASLFVLSKLSTAEDVSRFSEFMNKHIEYYSVQGLIDNLSRLTDISYRLHGEINYVFVTSIFDTYPTIMEGLPHDTLDKLAYLLSSKNWELSRTLLQILLKNNVCPSEDTVNEFLLNFVNSDPETKLKELLFLKLIVYHRGVNEMTLQILLSTMRNINEFNKLIDLIRMKDNYKEVLEKYQNILLMTLKRVSTKFTLHLAQFVRLLTELGIQADIDLVNKMQADKSKKTNQL